MDNCNYTVPVVIPAYEPDERLIHLMTSLDESDIERIIIVDDGSGLAYKETFDKAIESARHKKCTLITHEINKGKGRALKTAFEYVAANIPDAIGVVTADSDGQHTVECISKVINALIENQSSLVLGVRCFDGRDIPWKSRFGNNLTLKVLKLVSGLNINDTQTGLRGIPREFMIELLDVKGERFEFEMRMLLESINRYPIVEIPIQTIYDSKENHQTHFNPIHDSIRIYKILIERFVRFIASSVLSFVIDVTLFSLLCMKFKQFDPIMYITYSTVLARIISAVFNYGMNYRFVFESNEKIKLSAIKYCILACVQMFLSALFTTFLNRQLSGTKETLSKIIVDTILFLISYQVQKHLVFAKRHVDTVRKS